MFYDFITKYSDIFCRKNERNFCNAKASHIFSTKTIGVFEILKFEILTKRYLTTSLVLNNRALDSNLRTQLLRSFETFGGHEGFLNESTQEINKSRIRPMMNQR